MSLLHAPDHSILTSKNEKSPYPGRPSPCSVASLPRARSLRSLAFGTFHSVPPPPQCVDARYATDCTVKSRNF